MSQFARKRVTTTSPAAAAATRPEATPVALAKPIPVPLEKLGSSVRAPRREASESDVAYWRRVEDSGSCLVVKARLEFGRLIATAVDGALAEAESGLAVLRGQERVNAVGEIKAGVWSRWADQLNRSERSVETYEHRYRRVVTGATGHSVPELDDLMRLGWREFSAATAEKHLPRTKSAEAIAAAAKKAAEDYWFPPDIAVPGVRARVPRLMIVEHMKLPGLLERIIPEARETLLAGLRNLPSEKLAETVKDERHIINEAFDKLLAKPAPADVAQQEAEPERTSDQRAAVEASVIAVANPFPDPADLLRALLRTDVGDTSTAANIEAPLREAAKAAGVSLPTDRNAVSRLLRSIGVRAKPSASKGNTAAVYLVGEWVAAQLGTVGGAS